MLVDMQWLHTIDGHHGMSHRHGLGADVRRRSLTIHTQPSFLPGRSRPQIDVLRRRVQGDLVPSHLAGRVYGWTPNRGAYVEPPVVDDFEQ